MKAPRATVSRWKHSRFHAVHQGVDLVAVCVYLKGAEQVAKVLDQLTDYRDHLREITVPRRKAPS